jgi:hypothetical protein
MNLTDFINKSYVVAFVRLVNNGEIQECFFCCKELPETGKAQDIFNVLSSYLVTKCPCWEKYVGICIDDVPSMVGPIRGFTSLVAKRKS